MIVPDLEHSPAASKVILADNQDATELAKNLKIHKCTKYIDKKFYLVRKVIEQDLLLLEFFLTQLMTSDSLTKFFTKAVSNFFLMKGIA